MITVWFCKSDNIQQDEYFSYLKILPESFQIEISRFKTFQDRKEKLISKLLLRKALIETGNDSSLLLLIEKNTHEKPFIKNWLKYNISHSKDAILFAFGECMEIGIDIEFIESNINFNSILDYFTIQEKELINGKGVKSFLDIWVKKEAVLKAIGVGIVKGLNQFDCSTDVVYYNNKEWFLKKIEIDQKHLCYIATNIREPNIKIQEIFIEDLIL